MRQKLIRIVSVVTVVGDAGFAFQNCGKAGFDGENQGSLSLGSTSTNTSIPFAFNVAFDQIAYNSCAASTIAARPGFFTIMAGAYETAGVNMTTAFRSYANTSGEIYTDGAAPTVDQIKLYAARQTINSGAQPQIALRARTNIFQVRTPTGAAATEGADYFTVLGNLTDDRWLDPITRYAGSTNYFGLAPGGQRNIEAKITYNASEGLAQGLRDDMTSNSFLALTFKDQASAGATSVRRPASLATSDSRTAYGHAYMFTFESLVAPYTMAIHGGASVAPNTLNPNNIMSQIQEVDLQNPTSVSTSTWTCSSTRRYLIVQPTDAAAYCPHEQFANMLAANYRREYEIARRSLKAEYWDINVTYHCAVPKDGSCYVTTEANGSAPVIEYDQSQPCFQAIAGIPYGNPNPVKRCAQYVSICNRN